MPEHNPPSIRLKDQVYAWQEGKSILFDDSWDHEVYNESDGDRVVLIVDIRRPMPQPFDAVNRMTQAVMKRVYGRHVLRKLEAMTAPGAPAGASSDDRAPAPAHEAGPALAGERLGS